MQVVHCLIQKYPRFSVFISRNKRSISRNFLSDLQIRCCWRLAGLSTSCWHANVVRFRTTSNTSSCFILLPFYLICIFICTVKYAWLHSKQQIITTRCCEYYFLNRFLAYRSLEKDNPYTFMVQFHDKKKLEVWNA